MARVEHQEQAPSNAVREYKNDEYTRRAHKTTDISLILRVPRKVRYWDKTLVFSLIKFDSLKQ